MKSLEQMTRELAEYMKRPVAADGSRSAPAIPDCLVGLDDADAEGGYVYRCNVCDEYAPIYCEPQDFDPDFHYCGRSSRCCP